jgi:putative hydrolase of the HAD superfamily
MEDFIKLKAVLFDYDGVMTIDKTGTESICNYISKNMNIDKNIFEKEYRKYNNDLLYGKITHLEIWDKLCKNINKNIPIKVLFESFNNTPIDNEMHEIVLKIKNQNIKTGLITDNKADRIQNINEKNGLNNYFDIISISGELGYGKESEKVFKYTLEKIGIDPKESLFIDNQEKNLIIPNNMGIKTYYFNDKERDINKLKNEIKKYGIMV